MVAEPTTALPEFTGTRKFQTIARNMFQLFRARGMFMSNDAPIRIAMPTLQEFLADREGTKPADIETVVRDNPAVFELETVDDEVWIVTTRIGAVPIHGTVGISHSLNARFLTPEPKPVRPVPVKREPVRIDPNWATYSVPDFGDELEEDEGDEFGAEPIVTDVISIPAVEEVADPVAETLVSNEPSWTDAPVTEEVAVETPEVVEVVAEPPTVEDVEAESPVIEEVVSETPAVEEVVAATPVAEPIVTPAPVPSPPTIDLTGYTDDEIAQAITAQLHEEPRAAHFAGYWMADERVARLSRGDMRRMKDYIEEQEQPLSDGTLVTDILNVRPNAADFENLKFATSFRLAREHREFDFVGTRDQRFWSTSSLPQIGTARRKPNDIGTDYRFLVDEVPKVIESRSVSSADHILTFYEYSLGLLPFDEELQKLMPKAVDPDQRTAVLTFEIPQSYTTYLVELRYPTPNRGGFLLGLDDFYAENLVPGAMISVSATENDGHYKVEYLAGKDQSARLLELDDRRSPRYLFRPTSFACEVSPEWLVSEERFPKIGAEKPLDDKTRRRPEAVVEATFERIGIEDSDALIATFEDLLAAVNVERPFSETLLRSVIEASSRVTNDGSDTLSYVAGS